MSQIIFQDISVVKTLTGDIGGAVSPSSGNINIGGTAPLSVTGTPGTSTLTIASDGTIAVTYTTDAGNAVPALGVINILGGLNIDTAGAGDTVTVSLSGTTDHSIQVGNATGSLDSLAVAGDGELLIGSAGNNPAWGTLTSAGGTITFTPGAGTLNLEAVASFSTYLTDDGNTAVPALGVLTVAGGGNIVTSSAGSTVTIALDGVTNHSLSVGNAAGALTSLGVAANGQIPIGSVGANPTLATITAGTATSVVNAAGSITIGADATVATTYTSDAGNAVPALNTISLLGGTNVTTSAAGAAVTINATPAGGGYIWTDVTGATQSMAADYGYVSNRVAGNVAFTLPATASVGDVMAIAGSQNGWSIAQNAGQTIHFIGVDTTPGVGGSLTSTGRYDCIDLICIVANTDFVVRSSVGNITVV